MKNKNKEIKAIVYISVNTLNGKFYIGITSQPLNRRINEHKSMSKKIKHQGHFYRAIRKHGFDAFWFYKIKDCANPKEALLDEIKLIHELKPEYNSTKGGDGQLGRELSEEAKRKIGLVHKGNKYCLGRKLSEEHKKFLSDLGLQNKEKWKEYSHLGPKSFSRKVICLDDLLIFESASAAARYYAVCKSAVIELCLNKKHRKTVGGKKFMYFSAKEAA